MLHKSAAHVIYLCQTVRELPQCLGHSVSDVKCRLVQQMYWWHISTVSLIPRLHASHNSWPTCHLQTVYDKIDMVRNQLFRGSWEITILLIKVVYYASILHKLHLYSQAQTHPIILQVRLLFARLWMRDLFSQCTCVCTYVSVIWGHLQIVNLRSNPGVIRALHDDVRMMFLGYGDFH